MVKSMHRRGVSNVHVQYRSLSCIGRSGAAAEQEEDDPFVCDVTGALISMIKDGRYHFNDGRPPDDPSAACMVHTQHPKHMHTNAITLMTDVLPTIHLQSAL